MHKQINHYFAFSIEVIHNWYIYIRIKFQFRISASHSLNLIQYCPSQLKRHGSYIGLGRLEKKWQPKQHFISTYIIQHLALSYHHLLLKFDFLFCENKHPKKKEDILRTKWASMQIWTFIIYPHINININQKKEKWNKIEIKKETQQRVGGEWEGEREKKCVSERGMWYSLKNEPMSCPNKTFISSSFFFF